MEDSVIILHVLGTILFLYAAVLSTKNYFKTRGITSYWLMITVVAIVGAAWAGSYVAEAAGVQPAVLDQTRFPLAASTLVGYTASVAKAVSTDAITEII